MKAKRLFKLIAINAVTFLVLLAVVNWACGLYLKRGAKVKREELPNYSDDFAHAKKVFHDYNSVQHQYEPFVGWKTLPYKGETLIIGSDGTRQVPTASTAENGKSIHFFGGSTMWGEGSDDGHTIPALVAKRNPQFQIFNHGQLAYNSRQELDALISLYATGVKPDVVVFYDGVNDAAFLCPKEIKKLPAHRLVPMYRDKLYVGKTALAKEIAGKLFIDNILGVVRKATYKPTPENTPYDCVSNPAKAEQIAEMMLKNWEMANEIVTKRGGRFVAILQPAAFIGKPKTDHLELDPELGKNFEVIYGLIKKKIAERNHPWITDLSDRFDGDEYIYIDFCHVSPNGNEIIASEVSRVIGNVNKMSDVAFSAVYP
ncbi:MAG TPA: SGNH/GDSL hydrolase family protein [Chryseosolibacter sp.]